MTRNQKLFREGLTSLMFAIAIYLLLCLLTGCDSSVSAGGSSIDVVGSFTRGIK